MAKFKKNQLSWIVIMPEQQPQVISLVSTANTYRQIAGADLPTCIPEDFRRQIVKGIAMRSDTTSGFVMIVNLIRYDVKPVKLDQHPFAILALPGNSAQLQSAALLHHADYCERTTPADPALVSAVGSAFLGTNVSTLYPLATDPPHEVGPLDELKGTSHGKAFEVIFKKLTNP